MLPLYLLMILQEKPRHGTEMIRSLGEMSDGHWRPSPGSVYPVLRRLEVDGLVTGRWRRSQAAPQRVYRLTKKGQGSLPGLRDQLIAQLQAARLLIDAHLAALEVDHGRGGHHE